MFLHLSVSHSVRRGVYTLPPWADTSHDGNWSGRYAFYWNAFLFWEFTMWLVQDKTVTSIGKNSSLSLMCEGVGARAEDTYLLVFHTGIKALAPLLKIPIYLSISVPHRYKGVGAPAEDTYLSISVSHRCKGVGAPVEDAYLSVY